MVDGVYRVHIKRPRLWISRFDFSFPKTADSGVRME